MSSSQRSGRPKDARLQKGRKSTQRERLVAGMIAAANRDGYARANVTAVIAQAGVSRPTFYDYFADRDDCFLAALADTHQRLLAEVRRAVEQAPPEHAIQATIRVLIGFAGSERAVARFLTNEPLGAGQAALEARDRGIAEIGEIIEEAHRHVASATMIPDISGSALIGGIYRLLASRLRRGEPGVSGLIEGLNGWVKSYERPAGEHRWRALLPLAKSSPSPFVPDTLLPDPTALAPGRPRMSEEQVTENHRQRIMFAAARLARDKGYAATTIADITRLAGVDGHAFYALFANKQDAFMAVHELGVQQVMTATARAFFAGSNWPERSWEAGRAFTDLLERNPLIARVGFVESYAVGPGAVQRIEDSHTAFAIFLQEGYEYRPQRHPPPPLALEAIIKTIFELVYRQVHGHATPRISRLLPRIAFLWLAPFLGPADTYEFIDQKL